MLLATILFCVVLYHKPSRIC